MLIIVEGRGITLFKIIKTESYFPVVVLLKWYTQYYFRTLFRATIRVNQHNLKGVTYKCDGQRTLGVG